MEHEELNRLKGCILLFEQLCAILDEVGVQTWHTEYVENESFIVHAEPMAEGVLLSPQFFLPGKNSASVTIELISGTDLDSTGGRDVESNLSLRQDQFGDWHLAHSRGDPDDHRLDAIRDKLGLTEEGQRDVLPHEIAGIVRAMGQHFLALGKSGS